MNDININRKFLFKVCEQTSPYLSLGEDDVYLHLYISDSNDRDETICKWANLKNIARSYFENNTSERSHLHLVWLQNTNFGIILAESSLTREEYDLYIKGDK